MVNVSDYDTKKVKGLVSIAKVGDAYALAFKKFSSEDGSSLPDEVQAVNLEELTEAKAALQQQIADIDAFIADCKALDL